MKKTSNYEIGYGASLACFFLLCAFTILNSTNSLELSKLGIGNSAPENLRTAPESFRLKLAVERHDKEISDISTSESWKVLQSSLDGYATRLELFEKQQYRQQYLGIGGYLFSTISIVLFGIKKKRASKASADAAPNGGPRNVQKLDYNGMR